MHLQCDGPYPMNRFVEVKPSRIPSQQAIRPAPIRYDNFGTIISSNSYAIIDVRRAHVSYRCEAYWRIIQVFYQSPGMTALALPLLGRFRSPTNKSEVWTEICLATVQKRRHTVLLQHPLISGNYVDVLFGWYTKFFTNVIIYRAQLYVQPKFDNVFLFHVHVFAFCRLFSDMLR